MKELCQKELKKVQLDILQAVHEFCAKNKIGYYLTYGTLIGAIRHNGYIPWDDDIDICMARPDYEKFLRFFGDGRYEVVSFDKDQRFLFSFAKVIDNNTVLIEESGINYKMGINIDIFPIDGIDDDTALLKWQILLHKLVDFKVVRLSLSRSLFKNLVLLAGKMLLCVIPLSVLIRSMTKNAIKHDYDSAKKVCCVAFGSKYNQPIDKTIFEKGVLWQFESKQFYVPAGYDQYLKSVFGDYMKLPPIEKRVTHHKFRAYYK